MSEPYKEIEFTYKDGKPLLSVDGKAVEPRVYESLNDGWVHKGFMLDDRKLEIAIRHQQFNRKEES